MPATTKLPAHAVPGMPRGYRLIGTEKTDGLIRYEAEYTVLPTKCKCGGAVKLFGTRKRIVGDIPRKDAKVEILLNVKRFKCQRSGQTFSQELPEIHTDHGITRRFFLHVGQGCFKRTFQEMAMESGLEDTTVRLIFHRYLKDVEAWVRIPDPLALALFSVKVFRRPATALIDAHALAIVDLVEDTTQNARTRTTDAGLAPRLERAGAAQTVGIGFDARHRELVRALLPKAVVYVDQFFVMAMADDALEQVRRATRKDLSIYLKRKLAHDAETFAKEREHLHEQEVELLEYIFGTYPGLSDAYEAREAFREAYRGKKAAEEAFGLMTAALAGLSGKTKPFFKSLQVALKTFGPEVRAFFEVEAQDFTLARVPELKKLEEWIAAVPERGHVFEAARASLLLPAGMPARSFLSRGASLARLRSNSYKAPEV
ncbi:transposase [Acidovorax sp. sic0104]|uniref:transposase n=1 Tax=Acidovorax sp. sic0104 TaxID=2854784 RepID=UPI001C47DC29|nr:transposase [Acidovorax sp. sic0104]MBV7542048.1 transposase [Acidovorax sp. sic0104]